MNNLAGGARAVLRLLINFRCALTAIGLSTLILLTPAQAENTDSVNARLISQFKIGSDQKQFGPLEFAGGLEMVGKSRDFGGWSGIVLTPDQKSYIGITDTGFWIEGELKRDDKNQLRAMTASMHEITDKNGNAYPQKWQADAEGIALKDDQIFVSFERMHRVSQYDFSDSTKPKLVSEFAPPVPLYELRENRGFEGITFAHEGSKLAGALVGVSEKSLDKNKNLMAFVKDTEGKTYEFSVKRNGEFDVTDIGFLPNGNLILLERQFNLKDGLAMRLRHIDANKIKPGATVDGTALFTANFSYQIDNLEGLDITIDSDGTPRLTLVSDDNHSLLQRNLMLEFRLTGQIE